MKKTALIFSLLIVFFLSVSVVKAQDFTFDRAYEDYLFSRGVYDQAYRDYTKARDFYLSNQTLTLKEDARKKTLNMIRERDQLESVYLTTLRIKILEINGLSQDEKNSIFGKIDSEVEWYKSHKDSYKDGDPLEDLFNKSDESESRYKTHSLPLIYESLFMVTYGEEKTLRLEHENEFTAIRKIIDENVQTGKLDMNPFNRWFNDIDFVVKSLMQSEELAKTQIQKVYTQSYSPINSYNTTVTTLSSSLTLLGQLNQFLIEVLTSIRNQI